MQAIPLCCLLSLTGGLACEGATPTVSASVVKVVGKPGSFQLMRDGKPFFINGVGGTGNRSLLVTTGANAIRTWGADDLGPILDQAQKDGLAVTVGIWLMHADAMDYKDKAAVKKQFEMCRDVVQRYKDHPAVLIWAFGNEMEGYGPDTQPEVWQAINEIAEMSKKIDPAHPTMTVVAEIGGNKIKSIEKYCPSIDILGINSYAGAMSLGKRYQEQGGTKPYIVTEFGPPGPWEVEKSRWGAAYEMTSTEKAGFYRKSYEAAVTSQSGWCLGSHVFLWGNKQEETSTWFGMLLPDGGKLAPVDTMIELWTGKKPANLVPEIKSVSASAVDNLKPGQVIEASVSATDPEGKPVRIKWVLMNEVTKRLKAGQEEELPKNWDTAIDSPGNAKVNVRMPAFGGGYRLFAYVYDEAGGAAVGNVPLFVDGPAPK